jgi:hypothetical protein
VTLNLEKLSSEYSNSIAVHVVSGEAIAMATGHVILYSVVKLYSNSQQVMLQYVTNFHYSNHRNNR